MTVGVLALQGAVAEHLDMLEKCGARARPVKKPGELDGLDALIIPVGESTTIGKLMRAFGLDEAVVSRARAGSRFPIWGT
ncbi:MAG: pyridoxal 5'-phosphate synthase glutaminase subunit PdxT, partial [Firmicutes bacterium]|nr:pyridoxal 5'-phosphate synthase glutaminase subunit PdxT [Bacillota bacterium]